MGSPISVRDIADYLLLRKQREEAFLKASLPSFSGDRPALLHHVGDCDKRLLDIECRFNTSGLKMALPHEKRLEDIQQQLLPLPGEDLVQAIASRQGEVYSAVRGRWQLLCEQAENRDAIAKLNLMLQRLGYERCMRLIGAVRLGAIAEPIALTDFPPADQEWLVRLLGRLRIPAMLEGGHLVPTPILPELVRIIFQGAAFWLSPSEAGQLKGITGELGLVSRKLQSYTAQRQARSLEPEQEKDFESVQVRYLELMKARDGIFNAFREEEKFFEMETSERAGMPESGSKAAGSELKVKG